MRDMSVNKTNLWIWFLLASAFFLFIAVFLVNNLSGDIHDIVWRFSLTRTHLQNDWAIPYFTPGRCGGFLLAADAQDFLFTLYLPMTFLIPNVIWAIKIINFFLSVLLVAGMYRWLYYFEIKDDRVRLFSSLLISLSGYWVLHMTQAGQIWAHGLAYMPWVMVFIEEMLLAQPQLSFSYLKRPLILIFLFFLLLNSGYYCLLIAPFMIAGRLIAEFILSKSGKAQRFQRMIFIILCGLFSILLSWPRLGGVYEFQLLKFPRLGNEIGHLQVIGDTLYLLKMLFRSFFDGRIIVESQNSSYLGSFFEYSNFIGMLSLGALMVGVISIKRLMTLRPFVGLLLAALVQLALVRTTHAGDLLRYILPVYKQVTSYWRGSGILLFFLIVILACGYEKMFQQQRKFVHGLAILLMAGTLAELYMAYRPWLNVDPEPPVSQIFKDTNPVPKPMTRHYAPCILGNLYGQRFPPQLSINPVVSVYECKDPNFYNMHDSRRLASSQADGAYYMKHPWPLWPKTDTADFQKFINFKQVIPLPLRLKIMLWVSSIAWFIYGVCFLFVTKLRYRQARSGIR